MRVKFLENRTTRCGRKEDQETFEKDRVYEMPEPSARHWINRGVAVEVGGTAPAAAKPRPAAEESPAAGGKGK